MVVVARASRDLLSLACYGSSLGVEEHVEKADGRPRSGAASRADTRRHHNGYAEEMSLPSPSQSQHVDKSVKITGKVEPWDA